MHNNNQHIGTFKIHISEIIKYTMEKHYTEKPETTDLSSKHSPIGCRQRNFLPTIDIVVHLLSTVGHP
jgi:hypothetical protein